MAERANSPELSNMEKSLQTSPSSDRMVSSDICRSSLSASKTSSASSQAIQSPVAARMPTFRAEAKPPLALSIQVMRSRHGMSTAAVLSVDPSLTTMHSTFAQLCASTDCTASTIVVAALYAGIMTLILSWRISLFTSMNLHFGTSHPGCTVTPSGLIHIVAMTIQSHHFLALRVQQPDQRKIGQSPSADLRPQRQPHAIHLYRLDQPIHRDRKNAVAQALLPRQLDA